MTQNLWPGIILIRLVKEDISPHQALEALVKFTLPNKGQTEVSEELHLIRTPQGDGMLPSPITKFCNDINDMI